MCRFTIRELALVTVIVALTAAWWTDRRFLADRRALAYENRVLTEKYAALKKHSAEGWHIVKKLNDAMLSYTDRSADRRP